jgi:hypothetical protein
MRIKELRVLPPRSINAYFVCSLEHKFRLATCFGILFFPSSDNSSYSIEAYAMSSKINRSANGGRGSFIILSVTDVERHICQKYHFRKAKYWYDWNVSSHISHQAITTCLVLKEVTSVSFTEGWHTVWFVPRPNIKLMLFASKSGINHKTPSQITQCIPAYYKQVHLL